MMTKVYLHGHLGRAIGRKKWLLDVRSPSEAIRAINANTGDKLNHYLATYLEGKAPYVVYVDGQPVLAEQEMVAPIRHKTIHIMPSLAGRDNGGWLQVFIGVTLITIGLAAMIYPPTAFLGVPLIMMGVGMVLSGIFTLLSPSPHMEVSNPPDHKPSYLFSGGVNTTSQGLPVPVGYGELTVGSAVISAGLTSYEIPV
jgi:predicted phage tail protein